MKLYTKTLDTNDLLCITREHIRHQQICVKYLDGYFAYYPVIILNTEESERVIRELYINGVSQYNFEMARLRDIPGALGIINGFLILHERVERCIDNGVIDLLKIRIDRQRLRDLAKTVILNRSVDNEDLGKTD